MRCGYGLIHVTKRHKGNQPENWITSTKQNTQNSFDNRLNAPKRYGAITFFSTWYQNIKRRHLNDITPH